MVKERYKIKRHEWIVILKMILYIFLFSALIGAISFILVK